MALVGLVTVIAFEAMAVATAMPVVARALGGVREYGLAFSLFLTTSMLGIVLAGGWNDARGPLGPFLTGLALFSGGLVVSGTASSFMVLLTGRAVSGLGGGLVIVSLYVVVALAFPAQRRPRVFGAISAGWVLPSLVGPPVAGWLATSVSWRAVFLVVIPLVLAPLIALAPRLRAIAPPASVPSGPSLRSRAFAGVLLAGGALAAQWGLQAPAGGAAVAGRIVAVAGAMAVLVAARTLLPPGTLRLARGLASLVVVRGLFTATYYGAEAFLPLMLVTRRGLTPLAAGLTLTTGAVGWAVGSWLQGRPGLPIARTGLLSLGGAVLAGCVLCLALTPLSGVPVWAAPVIWAVAGIGTGLAMSSMSVLTLQLSAVGEQGRGSAALQLCDSLGGVVGIAAAGAVFAALHDPRGGDRGVFSLIWVMLGTFGVLAALVGLRVRPAP